MQEILVKSIKGGDHQDTTCSLKDNIKKNLDCALGSIGLGHNPVVASLKQGNVIQGSIKKAREFLDQVNDSQLLKNPSSWS
jgi:hypothetical protein